MSYDYDILFLGGLFPKELEHTIYKQSKNDIQNAANNLQWELVTGLEENNKEPLRIFNSLFIGSFPKNYTTCTIPTSEFTHNSNQQKPDINIGFCNLSMIKHIHKYKTIKPHLKKWVEDGKKNKVLIAYSMNSIFMKLIKYVKALDTNVISCLVVPDLPQYMSLSRKNNKIFQIYKKIEAFNINQVKDSVDTYVLLTESMKEEIGTDKPYCVIEGIAPAISRDTAESISPKNQIVYTGGLHRRYGVLDLIEAFLKIDNNKYELVICGSGELENEINELSKKYSHIKYLGLIKRDEVLALQKNAKLLVNPRKNNDTFTKYSFPSKILEYLASGTPVLSYNLHGIPDEYYRHIIEIEDSSNGLEKSLIRALSKSEKELHDIGKKGQIFVEQFKNAKMQTSKILDMFDDIQNEP